MKTQKRKETMKYVKNIAYSCLRFLLETLHLDCNIARTKETLHINNNNNDNNNNNNNNVWWEWW